MAKTSNPMKKYIKLILKSERVFCQRSGDAVYISDGISMVKMPLIFYNEFVRPLSGAFIPLEDGDKTTKDTYHTISFLNINGMDLKRCYDQTTAEKPAKMTRFLYETHTREKTELLRIFICDGVYISAKNDYVVAALEFAGDFSTNGRNIDTLKWSTDNLGFILCPFRIDEDPYNEFIAGGKD